MKTLRKILVVDDDAVVGRSFDRVLADKGYDVSTALNGKEALNKCSDEEYDVVFTDIKMPGMDGLEVARRIKAKCPWTPVVIITGYGTEENEAEARVLGASGFVRKPLTPEVIEGITLKALTGKQAAPVAEAGVAAIALPQTDAAIMETAVVAAEPGALRDILTFTGKVGLLLAAPFIGLAYALFLPFFGLGLLAWMGVRTLARNNVIRNIALFAAAPFIGLTYALLLPFVGLGVLAWMATRTLLEPEAK